VIVKTSAFALSHALRESLYPIPDPVSHHDPHPGLLGISNVVRGGIDHHLSARDV
jgi:hypothetical protein